MFDYHALFELIGIIAIGYVIARLILRIPIIKKFLVYGSKESIDRTGDPKPIIDTDNLKIGENVISNADPVKDFNKRKNYPLDNHPFNMPCSPITQKTDNSTRHSKGIISKNRNRNN
jgi:hypothetical protein